MLFEPKEQALTSQRSCVFCSKELSYRQFRGQFPRFSETRVDLLWEDPDRKVACKECYLKNAYYPIAIMGIALIHLMATPIFLNRSFKFALGIPLVDLVFNFFYVTFVIVITPVLFVSALYMRLKFNKLNVIKAQDTISAFLLEKIKLFLKELRRFINEGRLRDVFNTKNNLK